MAGQRNQLTLPTSLNVHVSSTATIAEGKLHNQIQILRGINCIVVVRGVGLLPLYFSTFPSLPSFISLKIMDINYYIGVECTHNDLMEEKTDFHCTQCLDSDFDLCEPCYMQVMDIASLNQLNVMLMSLSDRPSGQKELKCSAGHG